MIAGIQQGKGFYGILKYALAKDGAYLIGTVQGTPEELSADFGEIRCQNPRVEKPVFHMFISLPPEEHLGDEQWEDVAKKMMVGLGYDCNLYVVIRHVDEPHSHAHIIGSRIRSDTYRVVNDYRENMPVQVILRELEQRYGLRAVPNSWQVGKKRPSHNERQRKKRTGEPSLKKRFQQTIDTARRDRPALAIFLGRLKRSGVTVHFNLAGTHVSGISFEMEGTVWKGSSLGKKYGWKGIRDSIDFDLVRDFHLLTGTSPATVQPVRLPRVRASSPAPDDPVLPDELLDMLRLLGRTAKRVHQPFEESRIEEDQDEDRKQKKQKSR